MPNIGPLYAEQWTPVKDLSKQDMAEEIERWRSLWDWVSEDVKYYLTHVGQDCRVFTRNYTGHLGQMLQPIFKLEGLEVGVCEKAYNHTEGQYRLETKTMRFPASAILTIEFIAESCPFEELSADEVARNLLQESEVA